ncbi:hypothetical protein DV711_01160 [Motiliproteus coralliicola]|uniref:Uncharacterized protein n=1 Tax=Motiliproteus coralliicola TaxID=2283196 RepID=A0A369WUM1_9GAMM|nr:hypothetical protein [Motiliproteus coralliicola]RDE24236.1 hypothetical protein DV711_01160 [Motiliproteus coralliicola]
MFFKLFAKSKQTPSTETKPAPSNRRVRVRRKIPDRRAHIRFQPGNPDRRQNPGRRHSDLDPWKKAAFRN